MYNCVKNKFALYRVAWPLTSVRESLTMFSLNADQILNSFTTDQEKIYNKKSSLKISVFHYTLNVLFTGL